MVSQWEGPIIRRPIHKGLEEVGKGLAMSELPAYVQYLCQVEGVAEKDAGDALPILKKF